MPWLSRIRCLALALIGCGCGGGGPSADESSTTLPATTTGTTDTTMVPVTGGATSTGGGGTSTGPEPTTSAPATVTGDLSSTGPTSTTSGSSGSSGEVTASSTGGETTGGPGGVCKNVAGDYGDCETGIGWGFDGTTCRSFSGCDCAPNCDGFFPGPVACASACAAAGECHEEVVHGAGVASDPIGPGSFCDEVDACVETPELEAWLQALFPGQVCEGNGSPCEAGERCHLLFGGRLGPDEWTQICAATLLPGLDEMYCVIFGP